jgi:hypothetical protein
MQHHSITESDIASTRESVLGGDQPRVEAYQIRSLTALDVLRQVGTCVSDTHHPSSSALASLSLPVPLDTPVSLRQIIASLNDALQSARVSDQDIMVTLRNKGVGRVVIPERARDLGRDQGKWSE